jgi:hypothetical protein
MDAMVRTAVSGHLPLALSPASRKHGSPFIMSTKPLKEGSVLLPWTRSAVTEWLAVCVLDIIEHMHHKVLMQLPPAHT